MDWPWGMKRKGVKEESKLSGLNNQMDTGLFVERGSSGREPGLGAQIMSLTWKSVGNNFLDRSSAQGDGSDPTGWVGAARGRREEWGGSSSGEPCSGA